MNTTIKTLVHLVWDGWHYFYNRFENDVLIINARPITAEHAANIIALNQDDPAVEISTRGEVEIGSRHGWSWMATIRQPVEAE